MGKETHITGKALAERRMAAGYTQTDLARLVGCGRHAVSYWETKTALSLRWGVPNKIAEQLGIPLPSRNPTANPTACRIFSTVRARANHGVLAPSSGNPVTSRSPHCSAKTRAGHPCKRRPEPGRKRCPNHGGKSTGPKTPEGRERIAEAQRKRWAEYRFGFTKIQERITCPRPSASCAGRHG